MKWELIQHNGIERTFRLKVKGGWLIKHQIDVAPASICFMPDSRHEWKIEEEDKDENNKD
jgi:hypothetical protein